MSLSGPRAISGRRKLLKATLVGVSGAFQTIRHQGAGTATLSMSAAGGPQPSVVGGTAALSLAVSGGALARRAGAGAASLIAVVSGGAMRARVGAGTAALAVNVDGSGVRRKIGSGLASLAAACSGGGTTGPVTDPIVQSANADGWSFTASGTPPTFAPDVSPQFAYVNRAGFDSAGNATTIADTLVLTSRIRQPYPNNGSLTADQGAFSDYIYAADTIAGKTSNSTKVSPKPIVNWARRSKRVIGNSLPKELLEIVACHRNARSNKQVAAVIWTISDGTTTINVFSSAAGVSGYSGDRKPVIVYRPPADVDVSSLSDGTLTVNAKVYPHVGVALSIADSSLSAVEREFSPRTFRKNVALAATKRYVYVDKSIGNDTTGVGSTTYATAKATPCATVLGAINKAITTWSEMDNVWIYVGDDLGAAHIMASTAATRAQNGGECVITRDPLVAKAKARVSFGAAAFRNRFPLLAFGDIAVIRTGTLQLTGEAAAQLQVSFENCDFDNGGNNTAWLSNAHDYHMGTNFSNLTGNSALGSAAGEHRMLRGIDLDANYGSIENWLTIGCSLTRPGAFNRGTRTVSGGIFGFNLVRDPISTAAMINIGVDQDVNGFAIIQNVFEWTSATTNPVLRISGDAATGNNSHVVIHNNTFLGAFQAGRWNVFYDEDVTPRTSDLMSVVGNIGVAIYTKSDVFRGGNQAGGDASTRTGNWAFMYGVGCRANLSQFQSNTLLGGNEAQQYPGLRCKIGTSQTVRQDPLFTSYAGTTVAAGPVYTAGAGGGDYTLQAGSPCIGMNNNGVLAFDLAGNARSATASAAGAYERLA
ncbi:hypothetical protein [Bosea sp. UC22_33]|uniref:hypothetical protein n=1 Tax=Bosea sp. UC22_33 TaxID=3350165 RepID=UPI00366DBD12